MASKWLVTNLTLKNSKLKIPRQQKNKESRLLLVSLQAIESRWMTITLIPLLSNRCFSTSIKLSKLRLRLLSMVSKSR